MQHQLLVLHKSLYHIFTVSFNSFTAGLTPHEPNPAGRSHLELAFYHFLPNEVVFGVNFVP